MGKYTRVVMLIVGSLSLLVGGTMTFGVEAETFIRCTGFVIAALGGAVMYLSYGRI